MADALLSLATDLLKQLGSITVQKAQQEINLIVGVDEEIEKLSNSFKIVQAMLNDAEERQWTDAAVTLWLDQLRDVYYMMDDVLDKWNTARIKSKIPKEEERAVTNNNEEERAVTDNNEEERAVTNNNPAALKKKKVPCSFFPSLSCCFRQVDNLSLRHEIGHKVENLCHEIGHKIENLSLRHEIGHKIENLKQTLDNIRRDKVTYGFDLTRHSHVEVKRPTTTSYVDVSDIIGRDDYRDELLSNLLGVGSQEERNPCVISLVGMGGIGKTTLSQLAYNHLEVKAKFQKRMWVCVSDPFDQCTVAKAIIQEARPGHESLINITEFETLLGQIHALIDGKKFLLVLDDVWTEDSTKWESFKNTLKCGAQGSRILVTTRNKKVAMIMNSAHIINLGVLSNEDCWLLFSKIAFFDKNVEQCIELEDLGKQIANRCKGLPLAAKTLGSLMRFKSSIEQWEGILHSNLWKIEYVKKGLFAPLLLSFYDLPLPMKLCFLYCGVFPKDYVFKKDQLVFLWMAQGYIETRESKEMEITGEEYFENLVIRSFFQDVKIDNGVIIRCKMHDIVHDFAQSVRINEYFEINGDKNLEIDCKSLRHLSLEISKEMQILELVYSAINLRTLFLHFRGRSYEFHMNLSDLCHHFRYLRTLILDCPFIRLPDAVENLIHLRCLHMYENVEIEEFPETLCNLCNLQTLNIDNGEYFKKLPQGMGKLINLRQLRFDTNYISWYRLKFPKGIGKLTCLRTLSDFNIGDKDDKEGCKLGELKNLNQLRGSFKMHGLGNVVDVREAQNAQLKKKIHLHDLELHFWVEGQLEEEESRRRMESDVAILNALEPPSHLEKLSIERVMGTTVYTNWMTSLTNLKSLNIRGCWQLECLPPLGKLPLLKELHIWAAKNVKRLGDEFLGIESENKSKKDDCRIIRIFPNLRVLEISNLWSLEEWIGMGGKREEVEEEKDSGLVLDPIIKIMPQLESLTIRGCPKLKCLPDYLRTTPLQELIIRDCPILKQHCEREIGDYWPIISHSPTIYIL